MDAYAESTNPLQPLELVVLFLKVLNSCISNPSEDCCWGLVSVASFLFRVPLLPRVDGVLNCVGRFPRSLTLVADLSVRFSLADWPAGVSNFVDLAGVIALTILSSND